VQSVEEPVAQPAEEPAVQVVEEPAAQAVEQPAVQAVEEPATQPVRLNVNSPTIAPVPVPPALAPPDFAPSDLAPLDLASPQSSKKMTVGRVVQFGGYEWRVLEVSEGKALLLSEYVIEHRAYNERMKEITWEDCDLRAYLNGEFLYYFSGSDRERIVETHNVNKDNPWVWSWTNPPNTPASGGNDTTDRIFLLSIDEVLKYFGDSGQLANQQEEQWGVDDQNNEARIAHCLPTCSQVGYHREGGGSASWWWLRSPGRTCSSAASVNRVGLLYVPGHTVNYSYGGVRPAFWINS
jgi:hypothetical protein